MAFLDGSFAPAKKGVEKVGLTKKGKGATWMLVVEGNGLPLGFRLDRATTAEVRLADATLDTISVPRPRGRPRKRPERLVADRAYERSAFRRTVTPRQTVSHHWRQAFFQISRIGAHAGLPHPYRPGSIFRTSLSREPHIGLQAVSARHRETDEIHYRQGHEWARCSNNDHDDQR
jgi:hypothetical protein